MKLLVFALASLQVEAARRNPQTSFARQSALEAKLRLSPTFNPKCSEDDVDQGIQCESDCFQEYYRCRRQCNRDNSCKRECATKKVRCENECPCNINCYRGCPCENFQCTSCEELHSIEQRACVQRCHMDNNVQVCPYTNLTCMDEKINEYEDCINTDCPCKAERQYTCDTLPMISDRAIFPTFSNLDRNVIHRNMTQETLMENGFAKYFGVMAEESGHRLMDYLKSHPETSELFIGCKHKTANETLGIFVTPQDLFLQVHYKYFDVSYARSARNYFLYYSDTFGHPIGFTEDQRIRLQGTDEFDCHDQGLPATKCGPEKMDDHRMSAATQLNSMSLLRCGKNSKANTPGFLNNYETVGFYLQ